MHIFDAMVVGGNLCGLVTTYLLDQLGYRVALLERGSRVGGANASFTLGDRSTFDLGMHVLDEMRSEVTTRLFLHAIDGHAHRIRLNRGMVLRGHLLPYNPVPADLPEELHRLLPGENLVDELGVNPPTRACLRSYYGAYADFVFDEVLPSFRCEWRHRQLGVDESLLMTNIYPWFFPKAQRPIFKQGESRSFHDRLRRGQEQHILYPKEGGFAGFAQGFLNKFSSRVEVLTDLQDLNFELDQATHRVKWVQARGRRIASRHIFWCARWPHLCSLLDLPTQNLATDNLLLGSFQFNRPALGDYDEILIADPDFGIDRISFPGRFDRTESPLLQVEFAFPVADRETSLEADHWRNSWFQDLKVAGLLDPDHRVEQFDFKTFRMHYNSFGAEGVPRQEPDVALIHPESNIRPVAPTQQNRNLNGSVPLYLEYVTNVLARHP